MDGFHAHGAGHSDGRSVNDPDGVCARFIGVSGGGGEERSTKYRHRSASHGGAPQEPDRIGEDQHAVLLAITSAESLALYYTSAAGRPHAEPAPVQP